MRILTGKRVCKRIALIAGAGQGEAEILALGTALVIVRIIIVDGIADLFAVVGGVEGGEELNGVAQAQPGRGVEPLDGIAGIGPERDKTVCLGDGAS